MPVWIIWISVIILKSQSANYSFCHSNQIFIASQYATAIFEKPGEIEAQNCEEVYIEETPLCPKVRLTAFFMFWATWVPCVAKNIMKKSGLLVYFFQNFKD